MSGFFLKNGCCYRCLSITKSTVARAHITVREDLEAFLLEAGA